MKNKFTLISTRIIAVIIVIFGLFQFLYIGNIDSPNYSPIFHENKTVELVLLLLFTCSSFVIAFGLWKLKKWAFILYILTTLIFQSYMVVNQRWEFNLIIWPIIVMTILTINYKKLQ